MQPGNQRVDSLEAAFASAQRGVVAIDAWGKISWLNPMAEEILREADLSRSGRLRSQDPLLHKRLSDLIDAAVGFRWSAGLRLPGPVRIPARDGRFFSMDAVPMPRDFQALLSGVTVLATIHEITAAAAREGAPDLSKRFGLTPREAELADHLIAGRHVSDAADAMHVKIATARQHLKSVFAKTDTHRQGELVALLTRSLGG